MNQRANQTYLEPTQESGRAFFSRKISGSIAMLNLLRFKAVADYSAAPQLAPSAPITGEEAYRRYMEHTLPYLRESGGEITFFGAGGEFLIGPSEERKMKRQQGLVADPCGRTSRQRAKPFAKDVVPVR